jgi:hypothetical protein
VAHDCDANRAFALLRLRTRRARIHARFVARERRTPVQCNHSPRYDDERTYAMTHRLHTTNALALPCRARRTLAVVARGAMQRSTSSAALIGGFAAT